VLPFFLVSNNLSICLCQRDARRGTAAIWVWDWARVLTRWSRSGTHRTLCRNSPKWTLKSKKAMRNQIKMLINYLLDLLIEILVIKFLQIESI
jgi:hypothetical protein